MLVYTCLPLVFTLDAKYVVSTVCLCGLPCLAAALDSFIYVCLGSTLVFSFGLGLANWHVSEVGCSTHIGCRVSVRTMQAFGIRKSF